MQRVCCPVRTVSEAGESLSGSLSSLDNPEQFESKKQLKETMEQGIHRCVGVCGGEGRGGDVWDAVHTVLLGRYASLQSS